MKLKCSCKIFISQKVVPLYPQMLIAVRWKRHSFPLQLTLYSTKAIYLL